MELKVNENFAKVYNDYRGKEELQKLKDRYGDVKLSGKKNKGEPENNASGSSSSDSTSESEDSDAELWTPDDEKGFLRVYSALSRGDPSIYDHGKRWFTEKQSTETNDGQKMALNTVNGGSSKETQKQLLLKDYNREFLLQKGGVLDEEEENESSRVAKMDSDRFLEKIGFDNPQTKSLKKQLLEAVDSDDEDDFLKPRVEEDSDSSDEQENVLRYLRGETNDIDEDLKKDLEPLKKKWETTNEESEQYLRDYLTNQRWKASNKKSAKGRIPTYKEIVGSDGEDSAGSLSEDEAFMKKAKEFDEKCQAQSEQADESFAKQYPRTASTQFRFQEDDDEYIKQHPRHIMDSLRQSHTLSRAEKERQRKERKAAEKAVRFQEVEQLKRLKMASLADRLEKIRRTCGVPQVKEASNSFQRKPKHNEVDLDVDDLDGDWDPEEHDKLVSRVFGTDFYAKDEEEKPVFTSSSSEESECDYDNWTGSDAKKKKLSKKKKTNQAKESDSSDDDDEENLEEATTSGGMNQNSQPEQETVGDLDIKLEVKEEWNEEENDEEELGVRNRFRKRKGRGTLFKQALTKKKPIFNPEDYPDFQEYFEEVYNLDCEDILPRCGDNQQVDLRCRFQYRQVEPNDFGLSVEEILTAKTKDLNGWVSVKKMSQYRTDEEERKDKKIFTSHRKQQNKLKLLPSLLEPEPTLESELPASSADAIVQDVGAKKKRKKKKKKNKGAKQDGNITNNYQNQEDGRNKCQTVSQNSSNSSEQHKVSKNNRKREHNPSDSTGLAHDLEKEDDISAKKKKSNDHSHHQQKGSKKHSSKPQLSESRLAALSMDPKTYKYIKVKHFDKNDK